MSDRTYIFTPEQGGGADSSGLMAMMSSMLKSNGLDPNLLLAMNNNGGGFGGNNGAWFLWIIVILALFRNGFWGNGNNGNGGGGCSEATLANLINNDNGRDLLMSAIQGNGQAINSLATTLNCSVGQLQTAINSVNTQLCQLAGQNGMSTQQIINSIQSGNTALAQQLAQCCCEQRLSICQQTNTLQSAINQNTIALRDANTANTQAILQKLDNAELRAMQDKLDALREKNSTLQAQLSNEHQTAMIIQSQAQMFTPLQKEIDAIKCKLPDTATIPYSPVVGVPSCIAAAYGIGGYAGVPFGGGFWG